MALFADITGAGDNMTAGTYGDNVRWSRIRDTKEVVRGYKVYDAENIEYDPYSDQWRAGRGIDCRLYRSRSGTDMYCLLWASNKYKYISGHGRVGHGDISAAINAAMDNAGIRLEQDGKHYHFSGVGAGCAEKALLALGHSLGMVKPFLVEFYG